MPHPNTDTQTYVYVCVVYIPLRTIYMYYINMYIPNTGWGKRFTVVWEIIE